MWGLDSVVGLTAWFSSWLSVWHVHQHTIPASKGEPVVLVPIALHGDTDLLDGAINGPGVNMGEV
jgi:hypothetical protein